MTLILLTLAALPFVLPIAALVSARRVRERLGALEALVDAQRLQLEALRRHVRTLDLKTPPAPAAPTGAVHATPTERPRPVIIASAPPPVPAAADGAPITAERPSLAPEMPPRTPVVAPPPLPATEDGAPAGPVPTPEPAPASVPMPDATPPLVPPPLGAPATASQAAPDSLRAAAPGPEPPIAEPARAPGVAALSGFDWESLIGVRFFSIVAGVALAVSGLLFVRYSVDQGWLQPPVRAAIGIIVAVALLVVCERKAARRYPVTANALDGAAIAILFSTVFASHALWNLIGAAVTFGLLVLVTVLAVLLSIRRDSLFIAVLGLLGGFATPVLVSTGDNRPLALFGYLLLLTSGLSWVARQRRWSWLPVAALALTTLYQWGWVFRFLDAPQLPIAYGIFLAFPIAQFAIARLQPRPDGDTDDDRVEERAQVTGSVLPVLFIVYAAASPALADAYHLHLGMSWLATVGLFAIALTRGPWMLHAAGNAAAIAVWAAWIASGRVPESWPWGLAWLAGFVVTFLALPEFATRRGRPPADVAAHADLAAPTVLLVAWWFATGEAGAASPWLLFGVLATLVAAIGARAVGHQRGVLYFLAALVLIVAEGLWITRYFTSERLATGLGILALGAALLVALPLTARRLARPLAPAAGPGLVQLAALGLLLLIAQGPLAPAALWGLGLLLAGLNVAVVIESAATTLPPLSWAGGVATWLVMAVWWNRSADVVPLLPALTVVLGLALVMLAGMVWAHRQRPLETTGQHGELAAFSGQPLVALGAHLFLVAVAREPAQSLPPWPLFGVLAVLTFAFSVAALALGRLVFHTLSVAAAIVIVLVWSAGAPATPWPTVALAALATLAAYAAAALALARHRPSTAQRLTGGTAVVLVLVHLATASLGASPSAPPLAALLAIHVLVLGLTLWLTLQRRWPFVQLCLVATSWATVVAWCDAHPGAWTEGLIATVVFYALFTTLGFMRAEHDADDAHSYLTAVAASVPAFFLGTDLMRQGGLGHLVGIVPVALAAVLGLFLRRLLAIARDTPDALTRTAVVAGAALAFVTVAIPLQLETKWITVGWALEGTALAWLWTRVPHRGLLLWSTGLLATVFVRLALNPAVFAYEPRGQRLLNWYLYVYLVAAAAMFFAARWMRSRKDSLEPAPSLVVTLLDAGGAVLLFWLLNIEIADYYSEGARIVFRFGADVRQDLTYTVGWLVFGVATLAVGIVQASRPARLAAIALLTVTSAKCFLYDLSRLEGLARIASFVGLAISLVLVSLAIQRFVLPTPANAHEEDE